MVRRERSGSFPSLAIYAIMKFAARPARDVEDAVPYCGAGHIIDSRFSNISKFRRGQVTTPYRLFHPPSHISNSLLQLLTPNFFSFSQKVFPILVILFKPQKFILTQNVKPARIHIVINSQMQ